MKIFTIHFLGIIYISISGFNQEIPDSMIYLGQSLPGMTPVKFAPEISSKLPDFYNITFYPNEKEIYFTSGDAIMVVKYIDSIWTDPDTALFSKNLHEDFGSIISPDGQKIFFTRRFYSDGDYDDPKIWFCNRIDDKWSEAEILPGPVNDFDARIPFIDNNNTLYFLSAREGGYGSIDIYWSKLENGQYSTVKNLGNTINSYRAEFGASVSPDGKILTFARSDGKNGSNDIWMSYLSEDNTWLKPIQLNQLINDGGNQYATRFSLDGKYFFFSVYNGLTDEMYWVSSDVFNEYPLGIWAKDFEDFNKPLVHYYISPNPVQGISKIYYSLNKGSNVTIKIFNINGQLIETLVNDYKSAGEYVSDINGILFYPGVYFYQISVDNNSELNKIIKLNN